MNEKEMALVLILSQAKNVQPSVLTDRHQAGKSWSQIAHEMGISTSQVGELMLGYDNTFDHGQKENSKSANPGNLSPSEREQPKK